MRKVALCAILLLTLIAGSRHIIFLSTRDPRLISAIKAGDTAELSDLLSKGASPNACAITSKEGSIWKYVQNYILNKPHSPENGTPAIILALQSSKNGLQMTELLLKYGANPDAKGTNGFSALYTAYHYNNIAAFEALLKHRANANAYWSSSYVPLMEAVVLNDNKAVNLLTEHGANVNTTIHSTGWSLLMIAADNNNMQILRTLIAHGADINWTSKDGYTALKVAQEKGHSDIIKYFKNIK